MALSINISKGFFELLQEWNSQAPQAEGKWETTTQQGWEALYFSLRQMYAPNCQRPKVKEGPCETW